ncbi:hypothetical protein Pla52o_23900 [Novipirellula galeiformis]|uniref:Uncharacterized protein n=1 Tax=Novipirellula galeiformis TaxID=2528004 RepID=A0A5C6CHU3_9BACT|nr:hypothetical protein Pla52o_23900 [Novipirellula galeiformis]
MTQLTNPYAPSRSGPQTETRSLPLTQRKASLARAFGRGILWSLTLALPAFLALYFEYSIRQNYEVDPVTGTFRTDFTYRDDLRCAIRAGVPIVMFIMLPWAVVSGMLSLRRTHVQN